MNWEVGQTAWAWNWSHTQLRTVTITEIKGDKYRVVEAEGADWERYKATQLFLSRADGLKAEIKRSQQTIKRRQQKIDLLTHETWNLQRRVQAWEDALKAEEGR